MLSLLTLSGCATLPQRPAFTAIQQANADVPGFPGIRFWADEPPASAHLAAVAGQVTMLSLSGGAEDGAYGAGLLVGWSEAGSRPQFSVVSGVSVGALIAPFAFLGSTRDEELRRIFTTIRSEDIYRQRGVIGVLTGPSLARTDPLKRLIALHIDSALLDAVADEHRKGRRLLVMTTNLDAQRGVVWDMGAIAAGSSPSRLGLFRSILLASASVPGFFPPVLISAEANGHRFQEMHVDGATSTGFFAIPETMLVDPHSAPRPKASLFLVINNRLTPDFRIIEQKTIPIMRRALTTEIRAHDRSTIIATYDFAKRNGMEFRISAIGEDFGLRSRKPFDAAYMTSLFRYGVSRGRNPDHWATSPPDIAKAAIRPTVPIDSPD